MYNYYSLGKSRELLDGNHGIDERKELFVPLGQLRNKKQSQEYPSPNLPSLSRFGGLRSISKRMVGHEINSNRKDNVKNNARISQAIGAILQRRREL